MRFSPKPTWRRSSAIVPFDVWENFGLNSGCRSTAFEHGEGDAFEHDVLSDDARDEIAAVDLLEHFGELHQVRVRMAIDGRFEVVGLHPEVEEALGEDLDMACFIEGLGGEKALARVIRRGVDQAR